MPKIERTDKDQLQASLTITLDKSDYEPRLKEQLAKYQQQSHMKGFRKGKTPIGMLRKMYGKSLMADVINELIQRELFTYLREQELDILGQPIPAEDQDGISFDDTNKPFVFTFDIGLQPAFDVAGADEDATYEKYDVEIPDAVIDEELDQLRRQHGEREFSESAIREDDLLKLKAIELEGDTPKEDGVEAEFSVLVSNLSDQARQVFLGLKVGDSTHYNVFELEDNTTEAYVRRHFLNLEKEDVRTVNPTFHFTVQEASHIVEAEMNQSFFDKVFGEGAVESEEEFRDKMEENISKYYERQSEGLLFRDLQQGLMDHNTPDLPDAFLKRWLLTSNEEASAEDIEKEYDAFAENLRWTLVRNRLADRFEVKITEEEVKGAFASRVANYMQGAAGLSPDILNSLVERLMQDENQVRQVEEEILNEKVLEEVAGAVTIVDKPIDVEAFKKVLEEAQAAAAPPKPLEEEE